MRSISLAPLVAATGCNWIYGLEPTVAIDAAPPGEALPPGPRTKLVWAIATTDGMPGASGFDPVLEYAPIGAEPLRPEVPAIQVGDDTRLDNAPYDVGDGSFEIPYRLRDSPHRVVFTLPGESVPHEFQWSLTGAFITVPRTSRRDAPRIPSASGYRLTPAGAPPGLVAPALYTTGVFSYESDSQNIEQDTYGHYTYRYALRASPLTAPAAAPQASQGDWILLGEFAARTQNQSSLSGFALAHIDLAANTLAAPMTEPPWQSGSAVERTYATNTCPGASCIPASNPSQMAQRLDVMLGSLGGADSQQLEYGVTPSSELPGFLPGVAPTYIERPLLLPFLISTSVDNQLRVADPSDQLGLERVLAVRFSTSRTVGGVTLTSSIQAITNVFAGTMPYPAPLVGNVKLGAVDLSSNASDGVPVPTSSSPVKLTFSAEPGYKADDYVVTLYELSRGSLAPVRVYHVLQPEVTIDSTLLAAGHTYVFGITARSGFGGADRGDYRKATYPFGVSTTFPRTFVVQ